jgi:NRAMP (natural resistance-associated macrophage protein)-like metal ion transporter
LGPLEVRDGSGLVRVPGAKERALLADLLVHAGRVVALSAKLGIATGQDLAAAVGSRLRPPARIGYWLVAEGAMLATEMAELIGVVVALRLLLGIGLVPAIVLGGALVLGLLASPSMRRIERVIFVLLGVIGAVYAVEVALARPSAGPILAGAAGPSLNGESLPIAVGILGAVVMPHNLFLHSGLIRSRCGGEPPRRVLRRSTIETAVALNLALFVNAAILIMAAATFGRHGIVVDSLGQAHETLRPLLGPLAAGGFAIALLASSTTGSLAGQLVLDGLLGWRVPAIARRAVTMVPAVIITSSCWPACSPDPADGPLCGWVGQRPPAREPGVGPVPPLDRRLAEHPAQQVLATVLQPGREVDQPGVEVAQDDPLVGQRLDRGPQLARASRGRGMAVALQQPGRLLALPPGLGDQVADPGQGGPDPWQGGVGPLDRPVLGVRHGG